MSNQIKDFDKLAPPKRVVKIAGEEVDVSKIPSRVTLEIARLADNADKLNSEEGFIKSLELVAMACKPSNEKITVDWLLDNTDFDTLMDFCEYVLEPIRKRTEGGGTGKNPKAKP